MIVSNWQLMKVGFFIALGWWIAATLSDALSFIFAYAAIIMQAQVS